ncbi:hypothetical protein [Deinococcus sp. NW-56]|uniref:TerC family protein n=1 Tax=Deinococcus sp. NW-56 TaxID=2080419 RepID=UPI000CF52A1E|nr:hypothetical protein [Deinococcus sp. NW-56]
MELGVWVWLGFALGLGGLFALDLWGLRRGPLQPRHALRRTLGWTALALLLAAALHRSGPPGAAGDFLAAYLKLLPVESIFVFTAVFGALGIPRELQARVVLWGVLGALAARAAVTLLGAQVVGAFAWVLPTFGALLLVVGLRRLGAAGAPHAPDLTPLQGRLRRALRVAEAQGERFFVRGGGGWRATPLLLALVLIEITDVVFALDVIPAVLAITTDGFLLLAANALALLSFRSLYFLLAGLTDRLTHVPLGVALGVIFAGVKLILAPVWTMPTALYLAVYAALILVPVLISLRRSTSRPGRAL